jgi:spore germination protein
VSKKGGHVLSMLNTRSIDNTKMTKEKAVPIAKKFLADRRIMNMEATYVLEQQNTGVVIFEYKQDSVLVYPDLMKVKVALDNGEITGFEGTGFVMNHMERKLPKPKINEEEAMAKVNPDLKIVSKRLALIPLETLQEVLAYEFKGQLKGDTFIVYINALTGAEERILRVIDTNGGPVTM